MFHYIRKKLTQAQIIALGYFLVIAAGTLILMLPIATKSGEMATPLTALFTATSATCVTGLVVVDTASYWSLFGQCIILLMIQVGGLGFMTIGVLFAMFLNKKISLKTRGILQESMNTNQVGGVVRLVRKALIGTAVIEMAGALLLMIRFIPEFGFARGIYFGIFHAVSAFCNAGFDLMGTSKGPYSSFTAYADDALINVTIMALIVVGGIGFFVWDDICHNKLHIKKYKLHTKIVLSCTAILIVGGALFIYLFEKDGLMAGMSAREAVLTSAFSSVTARTAGFNTIDTAGLTTSSKMLTVLLMFIGGSPGSTAGGIKTTTLMVLLFYVVSNVRQTYGVEVFGRRLQDESIRQSACILTINLCLTIVASILIMTVQNLPMSAVLFETCSAMGTSGMSTGVTRSLNTFSRFMIIMLMYCGRIGSLSFALAFTRTKRKPHVQLPPERITVG